MCRAHANRPRRFRMQARFAGNVPNECWGSGSESFCCRDLDEK